MLKVYTLCKIWKTSESASSRCAESSYPSVSFYSQMTPRDTKRHHTLCWPSALMEAIVRLRSHSCECGVWPTSGDLGNPLALQDNFHITCLVPDEIDITCLFSTPQGSLQPYCWIYIVWRDRTACSASVKFRLALPQHQKFLHETFFLHTTKSKMMRRPP